MAEELGTGTRRRDYFEVDGGQYAQLVFDQKEAPVPERMDGDLYLYY
jgi:hypothetical protein